MNKYIIILLLSFIVGCAAPTWTSISNNSSNRMIEYVFNKHQFDSICNADTIPNNLDLWINLPLRNYEDKSIIQMYMYIKKLDPEIIYTLNKEDSIYLLNKRL